MPRTDSGAIRVIRFATSATFATRCCLARNSLSDGRAFEIIGLSFSSRRDRVKFSALHRLRTWHGLRHPLLAGHDLLGAQFADRTQVYCPAWPRRTLIIFPPGDRVMDWFFRRKPNSSSRSAGKKNRARHQFGFEQVEARQMLTATPLVSLGPLVDTPLAVTAVTPADGSVNISVNTPVTVQFNNAMNAATINSSTLTLTDGMGNTVAATVGFDAVSNTATLTPTVPLSRSSTYTLTVVGGGSGVADTDGNTLTDNVTTTFSTEAPLSIVSVTPANNSTNVSVNSSVTVQFDNAMDASTINATTLRFVNLDKATRFSRL